MAAEAATIAKTLVLLGMPEVRVELTRRCRHGILSPACLPFHHSGKLLLRYIFAG